MNNIKRIFKDDFKKVTHNLFALVVALGICILPALYAWFNIYSNWDPYGNTGNLDLAAVSLDKGYFEDEEYINVGADVIDDLRTSDSINWHFVDTPDEAREGVESGEYYAAIVINSDFTYKMYNVFTEKVDKPQIIFYENQKKNPIATKISDTVVEKIQTKIDNKFVKVITTEVFKDINKISDDVDEEGGIDGFVEKLQNISDDLTGYQNIITSVIAGNAVLTAAIDSAQSDTNTMADKAAKSADALSRTNDSLYASQATLEDYNNQVNLVVATIQGSLNDISNRLTEQTVLNDMRGINDAVKQTKSDIKIIRTDMNALKEALQEFVDNEDIPSADIEKAEEAIFTLEELDKAVGKVEDLVEKLEFEDVGAVVINRTEKEEAEIKAKVQEIQLEILSSQMTINGTLIPQLRDTIDNLEIVITDATILMRQMSSTMTGMNKVFNSLTNAVNAGNTSLAKTNDAIGEVNKRLIKVIDKVKKASDNEMVQVLLDTFNGDPDMYGEFFSEPVTIQSTAVYPVENYGSAVAPFYTVLSIWVGAIIFAAIVHVTPDKRQYFYMKETELFFGRYLMYFFLGQLQTVITVIGDIAFLGVQCVHPFMFYFACAFTSLTFTLLIYSLVVAFSDVGKAIAVVILVLQIAGSSGTYPIELLPDFFQSVYLFFPFPYAIDALRECVGGLYEMDYLIYLLKLSLFIVLALAIGIWIRKPFHNLKNYFEMRMENTKMM